MDGNPVPFFFADIDKVAVIARCENMSNIRSMAIRAQGSLGSIEIGENIPLVMHGSAMHKAGDDCPNLDSEDDFGEDDMRMSIAGRSLGGITSPQKMKDAVPKPLKIKKTKSVAFTYQGSEIEPEMDRCLSPMKGPVSHNELYSNMPSIIKNEKLAKYSKIIQTDSKTVEHIVFVLFSGPKGKALLADVTYIRPDNPDKKHTVDMSLHLEDFLVETNMETITRLARSLPYFKSLNRFGDMHKNYYTGVTNSEAGSPLDARTLFRKVKMFVPLYFIKKCLLHKVKALQVEKYIALYRSDRQLPLDPRLDITTESDTAHI